jgi:hypothetical protein
MAGIILAILIMADGAMISAPMPDVEACLKFTRAIAAYVESANCIIV